MQDAALCHAVFEMTRGHPLCASIVAQVWQERPFGPADLPAFRGSFSDRAVTKWVLNCILGPEQLGPEQHSRHPRLQHPYDELVRYGVLLRGFDLPLLRQVFPDWVDVGDQVFQRLIHYSFIIRRTDGRYAFHELLRQVQAAYVRRQLPEHWRKYHGRAVTYFEERLVEASKQGSDATIDEATRINLIEARYHRLNLDEQRGLDLVRENFSSFLRRYNLALCAELSALLRSLEETSAKTKHWADYLDLQLVQARASWETAFDALENLLAHDLPLELEIEARWNLGITLDYRGERERALQELSRAFERSTNLSKMASPPDLALQARILTRLGILQGGLVDFETAYRSLNKALELGRQAGSQRIVIDTLNEVNYLLQKYDRFEDAEPILLEIIRLSEEMADAREEGLAHARLGEYLITKFDFSERTYEHLKKAAHLLHKVDDVQSLAWANRNLGLLFMGRNEPLSAQHLFEKSIEGHKQREATRGLFRSQVALCECLGALSEYEKIRDMAPEIEALGEQVVLGDWMARWRVVQGHCEVADASQGEVGLLRAQHRYLEALRIGMDFSCSLVYQLADQIAARLRWLRAKGQSNDAELIATLLFDAWLNEPPDKEGSLSEIEKRKCVPLEDLSVSTRIRSALDEGSS